MIIFPAIDIKDSKCVRLKQGKADATTIYYENPIDAAMMWKAEGAEYLHIVDLDGAFNGELKNLDIVLKIKEKTGLFVELGGGIRNKEVLRKIMAEGIDRAIFGTAALNDDSLVSYGASNYKGKVAVSVDSLKGKAAYDGWTGVSSTSTIELIGSMVSLGIDTFVYTDISRDGMLSGSDISGIKSILKSYDVKLIASGGVTSIDEIKALKEANVYGAIIGQALYSRSLDLKDALEVAKCY